MLLNAPESFVKEMAAEGYTYVSADEAPAVGTYDAVQLFVHTKQELEHFAPAAVAVLKEGGILWVAYLKRSSGIKTDLTRDTGWQVMAELGYAGVRQVAIDETWSSLRFKHTTERKEPSMFGVDMPGIDRATKTVIPPDDMRQAMEQAGVLEAFEKLAFTHRKEHVVAVLETKRPETRARRIAKTVESLKTAVK